MLPENTRHNLLMHIQKFANYVFFDIGTIFKFFDTPPYPWFGWILSIGGMYLVPKPAYLQYVWPWTSYLTTLNLFYKMGVIPLTY